MAGKNVTLYETDKCGTIQLDKPIYPVTKATNLIDNAGERVTVTKFKIVNTIEGIEPELDTFYLVPVGEGFYQEFLYKDGEWRTISGDAGAVIDTKLDKVSEETTYPQAYIKTAEGEQEMQNIVSGSAQANSIVQRDANGNIKVGTPTDINDAATKQMVDIKLNKVTNATPFTQVYSKAAMGTQQMVDISNNATNFTIPFRDGTGNFKISTPTDNAHATTKLYVDGLLNSKEDTSNKVTLASSNTATQYPNAQSVWNNLQNVREVAEGKTKTYVLNVNSQSATSRTYQSLRKFDGSSFSSQSELTTYIGSLSFLNASFDSQNDSIVWSGYIIVNDTGTQGTIIRNNDPLKVGDVILVTKLDVPDRWYSGLLAGATPGFYKLETSKIDLSLYATISYVDSTFLKSSGGTMTGTLEMGNNLLKATLIEDEGQSLSIMVVSDDASLIIENDTSNVEIYAETDLSLYGNESTTFIGAAPKYKTSSADTNPRDILIHTATETNICADGTVITVKVNKVL